jgi:diaminopimelate epimerase
MSEIRFTKMHGIGNDYIYVNGFEERIADPGALSAVISDRHTGIGGDGLILILPPDPGVEADVRMRMFNADGSESEMCGNGVRCVCKFAHDHGLSRANPMRVQTGSGILSIEYTVNGCGRVAEATVDMGEPVLDLARIPVDASLVTMGRKNKHVYLLPDLIEDEDGPQPLPMVFVSMGNPHAVTYCEPLEPNDLMLGPIIEHHPAFPNRINVHFVLIHSPQEVTVLHWERGGVRKMVLL